MKTLRRLGVCLLLISLAACSRSAPTNDAPLVVFAASDLRDALTEILREHRETGGDSAVLVFGSTGDLATQIANGAPADLFFAANAEAIDMLVERGAIIDSTRRLYALGRLALIARCTRADTGGAAPRAAIGCPRISFDDLASDSLRTVAIADPSHAPYGRAAQQALERAGVWDAVQSKLVLGANVSQAELFVTSGNADAGLIALSLLRGDIGRVYTVVDSALHDPLLQTVAVVSTSARADAARALIAHVQSADGRAVMERYGFALPPIVRAPMANDS